MIMVYIIIYIVSLITGICLFGLQPTVEQVVLTLIFINTECLLVRNIIRDSYE